MAAAANKDEAFKCIDIAQRAFFIGDTEKAEKFLLKAEQLHPSARAKELLRRVRNAGPSTSTPIRAPTSPEDVQGTPTPASPKRDYTHDQQNAVLRITTKSKDYYEILGVKKDASEDEIKAAYKELALQVHPDKNHAPGATEAFQTLGNAVAILIDAEQRAEYDKREEHPQYQADYTRGFASRFSGEELFNWIFFGTAVASGVLLLLWVMGELEKPREDPTIKANKTKDDKRKRC